MKASSDTVGNPTGRRRRVAFAFGESPTDRESARRQIAQGVLHRARDLNWDIVDLSQWHWKPPDGFQPDGLITSLPGDQRKLDGDLHRTIPLSVAINAPHLSQTVPEVTVDRALAGSLAAEYYLERGFKNFAIAAYKKQAWSLSLTTFQERVTKTGAPCASISDLNSGRGLTYSRDAFRNQIHKMQPPLAIFCLNDLLAVRVCRWCIEEGLAVPEQVAILGCGNEELTCGCSLVPLSSVDSQPFRRGMAAVELLERMMNGEKVPPGPILIPPKGIVTRRSTDITAIPDLSAAKALRYIWDNFRHSITPDSIAEACGMHRRTLDRHFKAAMGRSVAQEITRRRLMTACDLLVANENSVTDIAAEVGFSTLQYFSYQFKRAFGVAPQRYRETSRTEQQARTTPTLRSQCF